jgi:hypothetical protein
MKMRSTKTRTAVRVVLDASAGLALFMVVLVLAGHPSKCPACASGVGDFIGLSAQAGELTRDVVADLPNTAASLTLVAVPRPAQANDTVFRRTSHENALVLMAAIFASLGALNLAFFRHLRRVNASPRRGGWGRG